MAQNIYSYTRRENRVTIEEMKKNLIKGRNNSIKEREKERIIHD